MDTLELEGKIRVDILKAAHNAGKTGAHIAPSLSIVELVTSILLHMGNRDKFVLSKGHGALGYYASMHQLGMISDNEFESFEIDGGKYPGQPCRDNNEHILYSSGSLGMGLGYAAGLAFANKAANIYVLMGDGELNEGSVWEAVALCARLKLNNLIVMIDNNNLQSDGTCNEVLNIDVASVLNSFMWQVISCDGHNIEALSSAIDNRSADKPTVIIGKTTKGKGISFMENNNSWHHNVLDDADYEKSLLEINTHYGLHQE